MNEAPSQRAGMAVVAAVLAATCVVALPVSQTGAVEVLTDDFGVSSMGPDATIGFEAQQSKLAFDDVNNRYLVVWRGDDEGDGQAEIYGQLINANTGVAFGPDDFLVARVGAAGEDSTDAIEPAVAWNSTTGEFVVVFSGDDAVDTPPTISDTFEIYAQRVSATGVPQGVPVRVSDMGSNEANGNFDANFSDVAYNPTANEFLVVWQGDDDTASLVEGEIEIYGQRLGYAGADLVGVGTNDFRISSVGADGAAGNDGGAPAVAYNPTGDQYYVTWEGNYSAGVFEVHGTIVPASGAVTSSAGTALNTIAASDEEYQADVAANPVNGDFAVVWTGDNGADQFEIYRQRVDSTGAPAGTSLTISAGPGFPADTPAIAFDTLQGEYVVVWSGTSPLTADYEVFLRRLTATGTPSGGAARISTMGFDGAISSPASLPDVVFTDVTIGAVGAVWNAENPPETVAGEGEIWGQFDAPEANLSVSITVQSDTTPPPGAPVTYRIDWRNNGPAIVTEAKLTSVVDALLATVTSAGSSRTGNTLTWSLGTLDPNESGFVTVDATVAGSAGNGDVVDFDATIRTDSLIVDTVVANNTDSDSVTVDAPPSVTIDQALSQVDPTNASPVQFAVVFSEPVTGFIGADVDLSASSVVGSLVASVSGSGASYTVSVTGMSGTGTVVASVPAGAASDVDGPADASLASTSSDNSVLFDNVAPSVTIDQASSQVDPTNASPVQFAVVFSEAVTGFEAADVDLSASSVGGSLVASVSGSGASYTVSVTGMSGTGTVEASIPAGAAVDLAGNASALSTSLDNSVLFDNVSPGVTINQASGQVDPTNASPIVFDVVFSQAVTGFEAADVDLSASSVGGSLVASVSGSGATYTVSVTGMSGTGTVEASIPAGAAVDLAGNGNALSTSLDNSVAFDNGPPSVTVEDGAAQDDPTNASPIVFDVLFSEPVTGLTAADVVVGGTAGAATVVVGGSGTTWTLTVSDMTSFGTVTAIVVAGAAADALGNASLASTSLDNVVTFVPGDPNPGVNDPPVLTAPASASAELGVAIAFTGGNSISVVDPDAFGDALEITVSAADAVITVPNTTGAVTTGNGTATVTITGSLAALNIALAGISVSFSEVGSLSIDVDVDDLGHTPAPALTDSATIVVTVTDSAPPVITVPNATVVANSDPGRPGATVVYVVTVSDVGSEPPSVGLVEAAPPTLSCTPPSGSFFPIGTTTVNCTATDSVGNTAAASFAVQVIDDEDPTITPPANLRITLPTGATSGVATYPIPTVGDNSGSATVTCTPQSGSTFPAGITIVTCTVRDPSGNTASATFQIEMVSGALPPTGGGSALLPSALAALVAGLGLFVIGRRRRTTPA